MFSIFGMFGGGSSQVNVNEIDAIEGTINLIDIREPYEYKAGHLPKAKNIPMAALTGDPSNFLKKDKKYYIICQSGGRSARACSFLKQQGYDVVNVSGGTMSYRGALKK